VICPQGNIYHFRFGLLIALEVGYSKAFAKQIASFLNYELALAILKDILQEMANENDGRKRYHTFLENQRFPQFVQPGPMAHPGRGSKKL
jgi:hypothetical protein